MPGDRQRRPAGDRGQAYTLEGTVAAILVFTAVLLAFQTTLLTPTTGGSVDGDVTAGLSTRAADALAVAAHDGSVSRTVRYWNGSAGEFSDPYDGYDVNERFGYGPEDPPTELGRILNESFTQRGFTFNVYLDYRNASNPARTETTPLVRRGVPGDNAVTVSRTVTLYDRMRLLAPSDHRSLSALDDSEFYAGDVAPDGPVYNVVTVRVVVW